MGVKSLFASGLVAAGAGALWSALVVVTSIATISAGIRQSPESALALLLVAFFCSAIICVAVTWTIGLAWHVVALRLNWRSFPAYVAAGAVSGIVVAMLASSLIGWPKQNDAFTIVYIASCAVVVSATGWLIRRPDRDPPNPDRATP